jgi:hypothetical protein
VPFAEYASMQDCMKRNADKGDPAAYCSTIMRAVEKAAADDRGTVAVLKLDTARQLVFGWASVAVTKDGETLIDRQGDIIPPQELEDAAYEYVLTYREADEMHNQITKGQLVESVVFTPEKLRVMGLPADSAPTGWWVGFKLDAETFRKVQDGRLSMFSIEGTAERVAA